MTTNLDPTTQALRDQLAAALVTAKARQTTAQRQLADATKAATAIARALTALGGAVPAKAPETKPGPRPAVKEAPKTAAGVAR